MNVQNYMICFAVTVALILAGGVIRQSMPLPLKIRLLGTTVMIISVTVYGAVTIWFIASSVWLKG